MPRETNLKRRPALRNVLKRIHMVFEGQITEPDYVDNFIRRIEPKNRKAVPGEIIKGGGVPITLIEQCITLKARVDRESRKAGYANLDEVWAIFDVDSHDLPPALTAARVNNIRCVISNPCFEVWGHLHAGPYNRPGHRHEHQKWLRDVIPQYHHEKNPRFNWEWCCERVTDAVENAVAGRKAREDEGSIFPQDVPSTNFDRILTSFDKSLEKISVPGPAHLAWWK